MFCPYCKSELKLMNGEYYCERGRSYFSKRMTNYFNNKKINKLTLTSPKRQGKFYCVRCGEKMLRKESMHEYCSLCHFEITQRVYYELIELNPHVDLEK